jgi:16S rRNA (guanine1516-N2)-methyltransferase
MRSVRLFIDAQDAAEVFARVDRSLFEGAFDLRLGPAGTDDEAAAVFRIEKEGFGDWRLEALSHPEWKPLRIDYTKGAPAERLKKAWLTKELLKDALSFRRGEALNVVDGTGGLLGDATLLATWGHKVLAFEQNPALCFLGLEALAKLRRAGQDLDVELRCAPFSGESTGAFVRARFGERVDRVYLDPLYPARPKDALGSKELRMVAELAGAQSQPDLAHMVEVAIGLGPSRVLVKRPQWEKLLEHPKLQVTSCLGRSTRFDIVHTAQRVN